MQEYKTQLEELQGKIDATWELLNIEALEKQSQELEQQMQDPNFWNDQEQATRVSREQSELQQEVETWKKMRSDVAQLLSLLTDMKGEEDTGLESEIAQQVEALTKKFDRLEFFLLFDGKHDAKNAIVSMHAGSGGTEAQDWTEMLRRMLFRYAEKQGWKVTILDESRGSEAGIKSSVFRVEGRFAYGYLQSEHGTHRLVRISPFDAESMRHTSFALIEVIPEIDTSDTLQIDPKDLRIDTFMSGGKGGQSVNTTYSAVRIVHIPTGITVQCQNERSQLQNKETALKILASKLQTLKEEEEEKARLELRGEHKSAEWGNQIRSYVLHPYKMVKDVRTRYESSDPDSVLDGDLDGFMESYLRWKKGG